MFHEKDALCALGEPHSVDCHHTERSQPCCFRAIIYAKNLISNRFHIYSICKNCLTLLIEYWDNIYQCRQLAESHLNSFEETYWKTHIIAVYVLTLLCTRTLIWTSMQCYQLSVDLYSMNFFLFIWIS